MTATPCPRTSWENAASFTSFNATARPFTGACTADKAAGAEESAGLLPFWEVFCVSLFCLSGFLFGGVIFAAIFSEGDKGKDKSQYNGQDSACRSKIKVVQAVSAI